MSRTLFVKLLGRVISLALVGLAFYFIVNTIVQHWDSVRGGPAHIHAGYLLGAALLFQLYWLYQIALWRWILSGFGTRLSYLAASHLFFTNSLLAYIPGKVANAIGMAGLAKRMGISSTHTVTTVVLFQIYSLISGTVLIAVLSIPLPTELGAVMPVDWLWMMGIASLVGLILISPLFLQRTVVLLRRLSGREIADIDLPFRVSLLHMIAYGTGWLLAGTAMWCLFKGFGPSEQPLPIAAVIVVLLGSYLVGLLAIAVPAGMGITEAGMVYGLGVLMGPSQALFGAASFRLVTLATTLISWLAVVWWQRRVGIAEVDPGREPISLAD